MTIFTILGWVLTAVVAIMLGKGAVEKIIGTKEMVGNFAFMKLEKYRVLTGVGELLGVLLLIFPMTSLYGMVLVTSFMSAAVVLHLALMGGAKTYIPLLVGLLTLFSYVLRSL